MNAFDEDEKLCATVDPDWDAIDMSVFGTSQDSSELADESRRIAYLMTQYLLGWILKNGKNDKEGIAIRAIVIGWLTLPVLRPLRLTELAIAYGFDKQSVSRWVVRAKLEIPFLKSPHTRTK